MRRAIIISAMTLLTLTWPTPWYLSPTVHERFSNPNWKPEESDDYTEKGFYTWERGQNWYMPF